MSTDVHSPETRSYNMSRIHSKNTKPEVKLRSLLHRAGFRFRTHDSKLPGKPDIILPRYKTVIFVNGCFWHQHEGRRYSSKPKTRKDFWEKKFSDTVKHDQIKKTQLCESGWNVYVVWECQIKNDPEHVVKGLIMQLQQEAA